jgi:hypothetical protein
MIEAIGMITVLAGMGIYFVKSTDLPKDLKDRAERNNSATTQVSNIQTKKKYAFQQNENVVSNENKITKSDYMNELELKLKKQKIIEAKNKKIDELTILITALEQELKDNQARNVEIQKQIDVAMAELISIKNSFIA